MCYNSRHMWYRSSTIPFVSWRLSPLSSLVFLLHLSHFSTFALCFTVLWQTHGRTWVRANPRWLCLQRSRPERIPVTFYTRELTRSWTFRTLSKSPNREVGCFSCTSSNGRYFIATESLSKPLVRWSCYWV